MRIGEHDHVVGVWAESPSGPGWSNQLIWVCIRSSWDGSHRVDALQPEEQTREMLTLFPVANAASSQLMAWVKVEADRLRSKAAKKAKRRGGTGRKA